MATGLVLNYIRYYAKFSSINTGLIWSVSGVKMLEKFTYPVAITWKSHLKVSNNTEQYDENIDPKTFIILKEFTN